MKNSFSFFLFVITLVSFIVFSSCDDDEGKDFGSSIVGTWVDGSTTMVLGSDGSYNLTDTSVPNLPQKRRGTYSFNKKQKLLTVNVVAVAGQNSAYTDSYFVQTLTSTTLVLLYDDGDVEGYYTRKK